MVDGFGISGTQGVFQRCAEETLRVLRDRSEIILTILEVFKYDPLHSWCAKGPFGFCYNVLLTNMLLNDLGRRVNSK